MIKNKDLDRAIKKNSIKAEDYEASVVLGWYHLNRELILDKETTGIPDRIIDLVNSNPGVKETGIRIARQIMKEYPELINQPAEQYGRVKNELSDFWKSYGASNNTPKTDIKIGDKRFSLKIGEAQLMSGGKEESRATFFASVLSTMKSTNLSDPEFIKVQDMLEGFLPSTYVQGRVADIIKRGNNDIINRANKNHKEIMNVLKKLFENNKEFKINFAKEAMSGFHKFGEHSDASANYMLISNHTGTNVKIHSVHDEKYCESVADNMRIQARFKSTSRIVQGKKTDEYRSWSVISLMVKHPF